MHPVRPRAVFHSEQRRWVCCLHCVWCWSLRVGAGTLSIQLMRPVRLGAVFHGLRCDGLCDLRRLRCRQLLVGGGAGGSVHGALFVRAVLYGPRSSDDGDLRPLRCWVLWCCIWAEQLRGVCSRDIRDRVRNDVVQPVPGVCGRDVRDQSSCQQRCRLQLVCCRDVRNRHGHGLVIHMRGVRVWSV